MGLPDSPPAATDAAEHLTIQVGDSEPVSGLLTKPASALACYVMAHGAGAGMTHPFMAAVATGLADRRIATLRYQFPFAERGARRPDAPAIAQASVRAAVEAAARVLPTLPLIAGGKSFGGRMTSQAQAAQPLAGVHGLVFLSFPLHPAGAPATKRAEHLSGIRIPMLFLQGTRDALADLGLLRSMLEPLGTPIRLHELAGADHGFHCPARLGRTDAEVLGEALDAMVGWIRGLHG